MTIFNALEVVDRYRVPTGDILVVKSESGKLLETLSLGDYGQDVNVKADFLGLTKPINGVFHGKALPMDLAFKWVITISTQHGCSMHCRFCDVPKVPYAGNATVADLIGQVKAAVALHPEVKTTRRLNLHFARMGEPTLNPNVLTATPYLKGMFDMLGWHFHPVVSTLAPKGASAYAFLHRWMEMKKSVFQGEAGLQISINSTDQLWRDYNMPGSLNLGTISNIVGLLWKEFGQGRKIALNFALADGVPIDAEYLAKLFNPEHVMCKITPVHLTAASKENNIVTKNGYTSFQPYAETERALVAQGFDTLVFVPSEVEDVSKITCGNAVLATLPKYKNQV